MAVDKTFNAIRQKYYWMNLYKQVSEKIDNCTICKTRNLQQQKTPLQQTNIPPYPWACVQIDLQGPFKPSLSGNIYIATFIDVYSGWIEAFPIPDKTAESISNLLIEEIITRHSCPLMIDLDK